jgi:hypothetical protein
MSRELPVLNEGSGRGFKILYPNIYSLQEQLNPRPTTKEEAMRNKEIFTQMKALGFKDD